MTQVQCWDTFEIELNGPADGNPFVEVTLHGHFQQGHRIVTADGFYDGAGIYRVRFMPDTLGTWQYTTHSNISALDAASGGFECVAATGNNHGPVIVHDTHHFAYADGAPHISIGTTCYAWIHQGNALEEQTLATLKTAPFNKLRMCVFPKHYTFNHNEPALYAFEKLESSGWDFMRFNPVFFRHLEKRISQLRALGIEADLILLHPYDRWGFANMGCEADIRYLRYIVARLAAYRNVWWSLANEYDLMQHKSVQDWDRYFQIIQTHDPYQHLRSIHNWQGMDTHDTHTFYDHSKPWVTHASVQHSYLDLVSTWREQYRKPIVVDECCYEGDLPNGWGNITAEEMTRRFWEGTVRGGYVGHGETYVNPNEVLWWSKGGALYGDSVARIAFLKHILEEHPIGLNPIGEITNTHLRSAGKHDVYYLTYFGWRQPRHVAFKLPAKQSYRVDVIDTWNMTVTTLDGDYRSEFTVELPGKPYLAVRLVRK